MRFVSEAMLVFFSQQGSQKNQPSKKPTQHQPFPFIKRELKHTLSLQITTTHPRNETTGQPDCWGLVVYPQASRFLLRSTGGMPVSETVRLGRESLTDKCQWFEVPGLVLPGTSSTVNKGGK